MSSFDDGRSGSSDSDSGSGSGGGGGGGGGSRSGGRGICAGGGRGRGRQRNGKLWLVKECPTTITGTIPLSNSEGVDAEQNSDVPTILPLVDGRKVYLEPELDSEKRFVLEIDDAYEFLYDGATNPAIWFHNHFHTRDMDKFYKSYKKLPESLIEQWFDDFKVKYCCPSQPDGVFFEAFDHMISERYKDVVGKMKKAWFEQKIRPTCFEEPIWNKWLAWWDCLEFRKISRRNKENRKKVVAVATGGSVSAGRQIRRMQKVYGPHIDEVDVYTAMHTRKKQRGGELEWASDKNEKVYEQYKEIAREKAVSEGVIDSIDDRNTRLPFKGSTWVDAVDAVTESEGKAVKKGKEIFGFGKRRKCFLQQPTRIRPSLLSGTRSSLHDHDPEKEKLREELSNVKDVVNQLKDSQEKMMQFFMGCGGGGGGGSFYPQQRPSWGPNMGFFPLPSNMFPPSGGMFPPQMYKQHYQPQLQPQQQQSGQGSASPGSNGVNMRPFLDMITDPNFVLPEVGGNGSGNGGGGGI